MPRKKLIRSKELPYHVTLRCNNKEAFNSPLPRVWKVINQEISEITEICSCKIHAFVLMPNHIHLMISTPQDDLGVVMQIFVTSITKKLNSLSGRCGRVFGARYHWSLIDNEDYLDSALKYIYRNPVKARLVERVEQYPFSSMKWILEGHFPLFEIFPPFGHLHLIPGNNPHTYLNWLNRPFPNEEEAAIQRGFRKSTFTPPKMGSMQKTVILECFRSMSITQ